MSEKKERLENLRKALSMGKTSTARDLAIGCIRAGFSKEDIADALVAEMEIIGLKFKQNEIFIPELLLISRTFNSVISILSPIEPLFKNNEHKIIIGTIQGDLHNIGKNLVKLMIESLGYQVIDLGVDVSYQAFYEAILEYEPTIVGVSALLSTTKVNIKHLINYLEEKGVRDRVKIMVGGAALDENYAKSIGADFYTPNAGDAALLVKEYHKSVFLPK